MRRHAVETSRRDVSNDAPPRENAPLHGKDIWSLEGSASQDGGAWVASSNVGETFRRNVSTDPVAPDKPTLFKERYRIKSTRLPGWDYTSAAYYFVTICTFNREPTLGKVVKGQVALSPAGQIADEEWRNTAAVRANALVDEYIVMPNHIDGILAITRTAPAVETSQRDVSNHARLTQNTTLNSPRLRAGSLGAIIGQFKSVATKRIRESARPDFSWQARFYEHIIRDDESLQHIRQYIADNPLKWELETEIPANLWM